MASTRDFGWRSKAEDVIDGISLRGKTAIVTGASSGIGTETARVLARAGADVVMACRTAASAESVAEKLRAALPADAGKLEVQVLDLTDLASVRTFAEAYVASGRPLHLLVNNAGVMATPRETTKQGHELQVGTNHVGHFLLTKLLRPLLEASAPSRIVNVSSALHTSGKPDRLFETLESDARYEKRRYAPFSAYGDSKLANVLFAHQLAKELPAGVLAFSLHPGVINTNLTRSMGTLGAIYRSVSGVFTKSVAQGAATTVFAATAPELEGASGAYLADSRVARASKAGRDDAAAKRLWTLTEKLVAS